MFGAQFISERDWILYRYILRRFGGNYVVVQKIALPSFVRQRPAQLICIRQDQLKIGSVKK